MKRFLGLAVCSLLLIVACTATLPVSGKMERSDETFTGSISGSGYSGGKGDLVLVSSRNTTCRGQFVYTSRRRGEGVLNCGDGRTGSFRVVGTGSVGSGSGELDGRRFTFTFTES